MFTDEVRCGREGSRGSAALYPPPSHTHTHPGEKSLHVGVWYLLKKIAVRMGGSGGGGRRGENGFAGYNFNRPAPSLASSSQEEKKF